MSIATPEKTSHPLIALVGNPNAGKTTLFNALTGLNQHVGNYPGVTVEKVSGSLQLGELEAEVVDVPGLYSLKAVSADEKVAAEVLKGSIGGQRRPDLLLCVLDATNLERNLFLLSQLADAQYPMVVVLSMTDMLDTKERPVNIPKLAESIGVDVVPVVAHKGLGLTDLKRVLARNLETPKVPELAFRFPPEFEAQVTDLHERFTRNGFDISAGQVRNALFEGKGDLVEDLASMPELLSAFEATRKTLLDQDHLNPNTDVKRRYGWAARVQREVLGDEAKLRAQRLTHAIDKILIHRFFGLTIFVGIMYIVFQSIYTFAQPVMAGIKWCFDNLGSVVGGTLESVPILKSMIVDGLITGVGTVLTFLPQILILFFFISVLEGTGYLARAAFLMDRLLGWCGLNGRAFVPLLSSFACAIPGIMSARVMPDPKSRLATILVAPLMSCSARLPVYILLIGAFIQPQYGAFWAGFSLFAMHFVGLAVAIPVVWVLNRGVIKGKRLPFLLEMPPYQWPKWKDVLLTMYFRGKVFVRTAGTIIVVMSLMIWALLYFPRSESANEGYRADYASRSLEFKSEVKEENFIRAKQTEDSLLGRFGKAIEPAFIPAGFDWRLTTAILAAFPAREVVVPSLGIIFNLGEEVDDSSKDLSKSLQIATWPDGRKLMTPWTAIGIMVFFALCCQCMATLATVKRETNSWKWPAFMFTYMSTIAYLAAIGIHQLSMLFGN